MSVIETEVFNASDKTIEAWYWVFQSKDLKRNQVRAVNFLGRELAVYRGADGLVYAMDAYCPHMGAHLAEGRVEGNNLRCFFHFWKFSNDGECIEIPCQKSAAGVSSVKTWPAEEKFGLIWIWNGPKALRELPYAPELKDIEVDYRLGRPFEKDCHPHVMMINAIDAQHFASVHNLPVKLNLEPDIINQSGISFSNTTRIPNNSWYTRLIGRFYSKALTYSMTYWFASNGTVTLGPDFIHFYIMFALRATKDGRSQGQTILMTKKRNGFIGKMINPVLLYLTQLVGDYFAHGDTFIFKTIKFKLRSPIKSDFAIINFIQHAEKQAARPWGDFETYAINSHEVETSKMDYVEKSNIHFSQRDMNLC